MTPPSGPQDATRTPEFASLALDLASHTRLSECNSSHLDPFALALYPFLQTTSLGCPSSAVSPVGMAESWIVNWGIHKVAQEEVGRGVNCSCVFVNL